ncbi:MAG: hypothetical protein IPN17_36075 [Deltaproteobacteria bacterium]|nr:hypothetical protein [Deltaproteobacteria bacterium]
MSARSVRAVQYTGDAVLAEDEQPGGVVDVGVGQGDCAMGLWRSGARVQRGRLASCERTSGEALQSSQRSPSAETAHG